MRSPQQAAWHDHVAPNRQGAVAILFIFTESLSGADVRAMFRLSSRVPNAEVRADEIFVYFYDCERAAKREAHDLVPRSELKDFRVGLRIGDRRGLCPDPVEVPPAELWPLTNESGAEDVVGTDA